VVWNTLESDYNVYGFTFQAPTAPDPTTSLACTPGTVVVGGATTCAATATDTTTGPTTPGGTVTFTTDTSGGTFTPATTCTLSPAGTAGQASCQITYTP